MTFIELTLRNSEGITINTDHIATFRTKLGGAVYDNGQLVTSAGEVVTEIMLAGPLPALAHIEVEESYAEVRRLLLLGPTRCYHENLEGVECNRRLTIDGACTIHGAA